MPTQKELIDLEADLAPKVAKKKAVSLTAARGKVALEVVRNALNAAAVPSIPAPPSQSKVLQIFEPKAVGIVSRNLKDNPEPRKGTALLIKDEDSKVSVKTPFVVRGYAPGMQNVEIYMKGSRVGSALPTSTGLFEIPVDISQANKGPLFIDILSWDSKPGDNSFTTHLRARITVFVTDGKEFVSPINRTLVLAEEFTSFSAVDRDISVRTNQRWLTNLPNYKDYGDAAFEHILTKDLKPNPKNPFTVVDGFLRIRATYDEQYVDPYGYGRKWSGGLIAAAFPDGTTSMGFRKGYIEARMSVPTGAGVWPAFWLLSKKNIKNESIPALEPDVIEYYGFDDAYSIASHWWKNPAEGAGTIVKSQGNISNDFHTYGFEITDTEWIYYFDGSIVYRHAAYPMDADDQFYPILNFAFGGGWPIDIPEGKHYDMWVDYVRLYK